MMGKTILALAAAALLIGAGEPARATPILAGQSAIFNFDYTGSTPAAPYQQIATQIDMDSFVAGTSVHYEWFTELNGGGREYAGDVIAFAGFHVLFGGIHDSGLIDGIYSLKVTAGADLDIARLEGYFANPGDEFYTLGATGTLALPEPATLALFVTGLLGLGMMRRRRNM